MPGPREAWNDDRLVAVIFALIVVGGLIFDATHAWFWHRAHGTAAVASLLVLVLVAALLRRHRFAWWIFLIPSAAGLPSWVAHGVSKHVTAGFLIGLVLELLQLALLLSVPMRRYIGVGRWRHAHRVDPAPT